MEDKTILEWLKEAKTNGVEWADEAINELVRLRGPERGSADAESLGSALARAFSWAKSEKGHDYWSEIYMSL